MEKILGAPGEDNPGDHLNTGQGSEVPVDVKPLKRSSSQELELIPSKRAKIIDGVCESNSGTVTRRKKEEMKVLLNFNREHLTHQKISLEDLPASEFYYQSDNCIGLIQLEVAHFGPLLIDKLIYYPTISPHDIHLVKGIHRSCVALGKSGGICFSSYELMVCGSTILKFGNAISAARLKSYIEDLSTLSQFETFFTGSGKLQQIKCTVIGDSFCDITFMCTSPLIDLVENRMLNSGVRAAIKHIRLHFPDFDVMFVSGKNCLSASMSVEATIKSNVLIEDLETTVSDVVEFAKMLNSLDSDQCGVKSNMNNIICGMLMANGQDFSQIVDVSKVKTTMEDINGDLSVCMTIPNFQLAIGTEVTQHSSALNVLGLKGRNERNPGENAREFVKVLSSGLLAGTISFVVSLCKKAKRNCAQPDRKGKGKLVS